MVKKVIADDKRFAHIALTLDPPERGKDYNEMLELVNKQVSTPRPRSSGKVYDPLTDEQRKEMSDKEIEVWEEKARVSSKSVSGVV